MMRWWCGWCANDAQMMQPYLVQKCRIYVWHIRVYVIFLLWFNRISEFVWKLCFIFLGQVSRSCLRSISEIRAEANWPLLLQRPVNRSPTQIAITSKHCIGAFGMHQISHAFVHWEWIEMNQYPATQYRVFNSLPIQIAITFQMAEVKCNSML